jgi:environmental stress-induced protein Ves
MSGCLVRRVDSVPLQPWKNGRGFARELAAGDGWRISLADVERDGPFSVYRGVTRHSIVVAGAGLRLLDGEASLDMRACKPVRYDGGRAWHATLLAGPVQVLNVMLESARWTARLRAGGALDDAQAFSACLALPVVAPCRCSVEEQPASTLAVGEFLFCAPGGEHAGISVRCEAASGALAVMVALSLRASPARPPAPG